MIFINVKYLTKIKYEKILLFLSFMIVGIGSLLCGCDRNYQSFEELSKYTTYPSSVKILGGILFLGRSF